MIFFIPLFFSCNSNPNFEEQDKIFHASGASGGIGGIYFALYKNHQYQICESGGLGETCCSGNYILAGDTIKLFNLSNKCYIKNTRLLICRYNQQDSSYWQWKYPKHLKDWADMKKHDLNLDNSGDVYQIDNNNKLVLDPTYYFVIRLDSLINYH